MTTLYSYFVRSTSICICFTAYTIMLELERLLKATKSEITINEAQELTKNMYQLTYQLPNTKKNHDQNPEHGSAARGTVSAGKGIGGKGGMSVGCPIAQNRKLQNRGLMVNDPKIPPLFYLDPIEILNG